MAHPHTLGLDDHLNVRVSSALRHQLDAAAKRERRRVTDLARIIWIDWLARHSSDDTRFRNSPDDETVDELHKLTWEVARNVPTTTAGAIAILKYLGRTGSENASQNIAIG
jgi:hypothetical protein